MTHQKNPSNQQFQVRVSGSSIILSFLNKRTSKIWLRKIPCVKNTVQSRQNRAKTAILTHAHALHIQRHVTSH